MDRAASMPPQSRIRVLLADDHRLTRAGIRDLLSRCDDIEVVGEAENGRAAVGLVASTHPDVVVMDISMPELNGIDATAAIRLQWPGVRVVGLSTHGDWAHVQAMLRAGATGFVVKECLFEDLAAGIRAARCGQAYFSGRIAPPGRSA